MMPVLELAVQDAAGARIAREVGAARVELCAALGTTGGLTPSIGLVESVAAVGVPVHALVRPRAGGFAYDAEEIAVTVRDIRSVLAAGATGVVVGAVRDGEVDLATVQRFVAAAEGAPVTFHRALDVVADPLRALPGLSAAGVVRVLTSGGAATCIEGVRMLARLAAAGSGLEIMAGGGVTVPDIPTLAATGVDAVHLSARRTVASPPAGPGGGPSSFDATDPVLAHAAARALRCATARPAS
ncbi:copper homeostasis protein CutC [Microbacteriaceae bacterium VKM Ac-2854]|nr:copper homeostasis protein CutC [Microbacteriaceae bacterium VKM Ac-2854]